MEQRLVTSFIDGEDSDESWTYVYSNVCKII